MIPGSQSGEQSVSDIVQNLRSLAVQSLARMYYPEKRLFAFRLRRNGSGEVLEGVSRRYTAVAVIGLADENQRVVENVLGDHCLEDVCERLLEDIQEMDDLGEVALTTWAARALGHPKAFKAIEALRRMEPGEHPHPTVERSWALTALVVGSNGPTDTALADRIADALIGSFREKSCLFLAAPANSVRSRLRAHVCCFADIVYPIQALSYYHLATGNARAAEVAVNCARHMCQLQGPEGQWWWHFDIRKGRVVERYPVYAVHQDSMAPMALSTLAKACGQDHVASIEKGLRWLAGPAGKNGSLIDEERGVIWRKVARREPARLVRGIQAAATRLHHGIRMPGVDVLFPPVSIDYESRPYHMGWILHAWPAGRGL
jgi:hypothetical protein